MLILTGPPGVGKSRLALSLISDVAGAPHSFSWWLRSADATQVEASINRLADDAGLSQLDDPVETLRSLAATMPQPGVIVFDDAPSWPAMKPYVDVIGSTQAIVTTATGCAEGVEVSGLSTDEDVLAFVSDRTGVGSDDAKKLVEAVDGVPLLLLHACQFIMTNNSSVEAYLSLLARPTSLFEEWPYSPPDYDKPSSRVIPLSLVQLLDESPEWRTLCAALVVMAPTPVPLQVLRSLDPEADRFVNKARGSFVLSLDRLSQTVEIPTLVRHTLVELGVIGDEPGLRERIWDALGDVQVRKMPAAYRGYLAEHIKHLGIDPRAVNAAIGLASATESGPLSSLMWRHAYDSAAVVAPRTHVKSRAELAEALGWALYRQGNYLEAENVLSLELKLANDAGCIRCRAPLLHVLGHLSMVGMAPENEPLRTFQAAESALRICRASEVEIGQILADIVFACRDCLGQGSRGDRLSEAQREELIAEGDRCVAELARLKTESVPFGASGVDGDSLKRWTAATEAWAGIKRKAGSGATARKSRAKLSADAASSSKRSATGATFGVLLIRLLPQPVKLRALVTVGEHLDGMAITHKSAQADREAVAEVLEKDTVHLREELVRRFGEESHAIALTDFTEMVVGQLHRDYERARAACRRFVVRALGATDPYAITRFLTAGLLFDFEESETEGAGTAYLSLARGVPWLSKLEGVDGVVWFAEEVLSESPDLAPRKRIHRVIRNICSLGPSGAKVAALLVHVYGHRDHLSARESLHYHRIAVRMYQEMGVPNSAWGHALSCYAHCLLDLGKSEAAERRFREARSMLTLVDSGSDAVLHIDEHLAGDKAPYLDC